MFFQIVAHFTTRTPTIKFRAALKYAPQSAIQTKTLGNKSVETIMDYQLPNRYKRKPPSAQEIDCINTGGATSYVKYTK